MNLISAVEQAHKVKSERKAAQLYNSIEYELALGDPDEYRTQQGEEALTYLEDRFPGIQQAARDVETPPALSRQASEGVHSQPDRPVLEARTAAQTRAERRVSPGGFRGRARRASTIHGRRRRRGGYLGARSQRAGQSLGRSVIHGVEGIVGLTLLGLLVSPRGSQAVTGIFGSLDRFLQALANPADTLFHGGGSGSGSHDFPIVPRGKRPPKDPRNPHGPKKLLPRPVPFPSVPPVRVPTPTGSPWDIPIPDVVPVGG